MGFKSMLNYKYSTTHENRFWNKLVSEFNSKFGERETESYLIGNMIVQGKEIDALFIKEDAVVVIDFKDYGGKLTISENENWLANETIVNAGRKNPFVQLSDNKYALLNLLNSKLPPGYEQWINLGHINALALFHQEINYNIENLRSDLSQSASMWFNIADFSNVCQTLDEITSKSTLIKGRNLDVLLKTIGVNKFVEYPSSTSVKQSSKSSSEKKLDFSELYYSQARSLETIDFLIIGQDPYPTNPNGVAFCKNSHYELFQGNCSGGLVINSLGYSKKQARQEYKNPKVLFYDLLVSKGICFTNINNKEFNKLSIEEIIESTEETRDFNIELVEKAKCIILLGKGKTRHYFKELYTEREYNHLLIHPSFNAKENNEQEWTETWCTNKLEQIVSEY